MCRLFAMTGGREPVSAEFWLLDAADSLAAQSRNNHDGTGVGWFDREHRPVIDKAPIEGDEDPAFSRDARTIHSPQILAHVRYATGTPHTVENTHPFGGDGLIFAHNGVLSDLDRMEAHLSPQWRAQLRGQTDSERLFTVIGDAIDRAGGDVQTGITNGVRWLAEEVTLYAINFVMITDGHLWAFRYPEHNGLVMLRRRAGDPIADTARGLEHTRATSGPLRVGAPQLARQSAVIVASEPLNDEPWEEIASGELVHIDQDLQVHRHRVLTTAPAHPMQLGGTAAEAATKQAG